MPRGRKSKLTPEVQDRICGILRKGNYAKVAAQAVGICEQTYHRWMSDGEKEDSGIYHEFRESVKEAIAEAELALVAKVDAAADHQWQAAMTLLERRHPDRWGKRSAVDVTSRGEQLSGVLLVSEISRSAEEWEAECAGEPAGDGDS